MPNIFDTSGAVQAVTANQTPIQQGVVDNSTAAAIKAVGDIGGQAVKQIGTQNVMSEARNILEHPESIDVPEIAPYMDRLGKIADNVKAGMQRNKAQIMARKVIAEAINQHPFYAKEIRERASGLFGIGAGSSTGAKVTQSPEEKALADYREGVTKVQLEYGVSQDAAQKIIKEKQQSELRKLNAENFTDDIYIGVNEATTQMQDQIFKTVFQSPQGTLTLEQQHGMSINIDRSAVQLQKALMQSAANRGAITKDTFETINNQVNQYKTNMKSLVTDQGVLKWMKDHNELSSQLITAWGNQNYGGLKFLAETKILPESTKELMFRATGNDERAKALIQNNPILSDMLASSADLGVRVRKAFGGVMNDMVDSPDTEQHTREINKISGNDKVVATSLIVNDKASGAKFNHEMVKTHRAGSQTAIDKMLHSAPENIIRWTTPQYQAEWAGDTQLKNETIDHELDVVSRSLRGRIFSQIEDAGEFDAITFHEPRAELEEVQGFTTAYGAGASAPEFSVVGVEDNYIRSRLTDMYRVLKMNPDIWEGKADSASEYINNLIKRPVNWRMSTQMRKNKSENLGLGEKGDDGVNRTSANS